MHTHLLFSHGHGFCACVCINLLAFGETYVAWNMSGFLITHHCWRCSDNMHTNACIKSCIMLFYYGFEQQNRISEISSLILFKVTVPSQCCVSIPHICTQSNTQMLTKKERQTKFAQFCWAGSLSLPLSYTHTQTHAHELGEGDIITIHSGRKL